VRLGIVCALARNGVIGRDGTLPWRLPDEMAWFRSLTLDRPVIMGRRTCESLRRPLPRRANLVVTSRRDLPEGFEPFPDLPSALARARELAGEDENAEAQVIGGARLYAEALPLADRLYLTFVDAEPDGDVHFPDVDFGAWREVFREHHEADARHAHAWTTTVWERP
jgi:dihydrofolate reductase